MSRSGPFPPAPQSSPSSPLLSAEHGTPKRDEGSNCFQRERAAADPAPNVSLDRSGGAGPVSMNSGVISIAVREVRRLRTNKQADWAPPRKGQQAQTEGHPHGCDLKWPSLVSSGGALLVSRLAGRSLPPLSTRNSGIRWRHLSSWARLQKGPANLPLALGSRLPGVLRQGASRLVN